MDLKIKAMTILAIFCVLISAGSACAAEDIATNSDDVLSIDMDNNVIGVDESTGDIADDGVSSGNSTNGTATTHTLPATGNPILALLAVCSLIGVYTIKRK